MNMRMRVELSVMMFLEFFIWGAWFVTMGTYLGEQGLNFSGDAIGQAYSTTAYAAILSPLFVGMVADRFFSAQKVLGILHLLGAVLIYWASQLTAAVPFFWVLLGYALCYMPTIAIGNAIAFNVMKDPEKEFPPIRVFGTAGWIVAGLIITFILDKFMFKEVAVEATSIPMKMAAIVSLILGVYSFFLPDTPPKAAGQKVTASDLLGLHALKLMKDRSFAIFVTASLLVCIPLSFYYQAANRFLNTTGMEGVAAKMTLGQVSEVFFMLVMPFFFARLGVKKMLIVGMLAWVVRYVLFAFGDANSSLVIMFYGAILLHGICYDFFFVTGQIYVDNEAPESIRAEAQGLIALVTYGAGMVIGNFLAGKVIDANALAEGGHNWKTIWLIPAVMAFAVVVLFAIAFKEKPKGEKIAA